MGWVGRGECGDRLGGEVSGRGLITLRTALYKMSQSL